MFRIKTALWISIFAGLIPGVIIFLLLLRSGISQFYVLSATISTFILTVASVRLSLEYFIFRKLKVLYFNLMELRQNHASEVTPALDYSGDMISKVNKALSDLVGQNQKEIQKLKEMEVFRKEFLGDVSHELKTPIFAIQGFIDTLLDGALEDENVNRHFLEKALWHTERLNNLVQDLLIISQLESGEMEMYYEMFKIHDLILEVIDSLEYKLTRKGRNIKIQVAPNGNEQVFVQADRERIRQVLMNLVDNAIKYGDPQGIVRIEISPEQKRLKIKIIDNGPGIEPEHIGRLFERFYRVDKSRSREKGGTGLGLAIVKHFLEAHNERIYVESTPGKRTTFAFTLSKA
jgi:two-component system phosphate regulon sensor histidine kinase PhoR